jgi:mannose-6-phosphate isomerase-like protein (cupin superfamily)
MAVVTGAGQFVAGDAGVHYTEHVRTADLSVGTYSLARGATDGQSPHTEDEVYVVISGRARFEDPAGIVDIRPGDTIVVPAGARHRFLDIEEDLTLVVVFAPPEDTRAEPGGTS